MAVADRCSCVPESERSNLWILMAFVFSAVAGLGIVFYLEATILATGVSIVILAIFIAPIIEEGVKSLPVFLAPGKYIMVAIMSGMGFGMVESFAHFAQTGVVFIGFGFLAHIGFASIYGIARQYSKEEWIWILALIGSMVTHGFVNWITISFYGV